MVNVSTVVESNLIEEQTSRDEFLNQLVEREGSLRESAIWCIGKFETVLGEYMTVNNVVEFFDSNINTVKNYTKSDSPYLKELQDSGLVQLNYLEAYNMKKDYLSSADDNDLENDVTMLWSINSRGAILFSLKSVVKLGMFMTGTPMAKAFRNKVLNTLELQVHQEKVGNKFITATLKHYVETIKLTNPMDPFPFATALVNNACKEAIRFNNTSTSGIAFITEYFKELKGDIERLYEDTIDLYDDVKVGRVNGDRDTLRINKNQLSDLLVEVGYRYTECLQLRSDMLEAVTKEYKTVININFSSIVEERSEDVSKHNTMVGRYRDVLTAWGIFDVVETKYPYKNKNKGIRTIRTFKFSDKYKWMDVAVIGRIGRAVTSGGQNIEFSEYGAKLINYILDSIKYGLLDKDEVITEDQFNDWLFFGGESIQPNGWSESEDVLLREIKTPRKYPNAKGKKAKKIKTPKIVKGAIDDLNCKVIENTGSIELITSDEVELVTSVPAQSNEPMTAYLTGSEEVSVCVVNVDYVDGDGKFPIL